MEEESQRGGRTARASLGDRVVALALYLFVLFLAVTEVSWLAHSVAQYLQFQGAHDLASEGYKVVPGRTMQGPVYLHSSPSTYGASPALVHIGQINVADQTAQVVVTLEIPQSAWLPVVDTSTGRSILCGSNQKYLCPQYADDDMSLVDGTSQLAIPIGTLYSAQTFSQTMTLSITGDPSLYPFDAYQLNLFFTLNLPRELWSTQPMGDHHGMGILPLVVGVDTAISMQNYSLAFAYPSDEPGGLPVTDILIQRDTASKWYILGIALIPLMLSILFGHFLLSRRSPEKRLGLEALIALATFVIAVLPLRAVLVPPDVAGLTYVDTLLGLGLLLIVVVLATLYAHSTWAAGTVFRRGATRNQRQSALISTTPSATAHHREGRTKKD